MPAIRQENRRVFQGNLAESEAFGFEAPGFMDRLFRLPATAVTPQEWRFGGITLRHGPGMACTGLEATSPDALCVVLARTGERGSGEITLSIRSLDDCATCSITARPDTLTLALDGLAGSGSQPPRETICLDPTCGAGALLAHHMLHLARQIAHVPHDRLESLAMATRALVEMCLAPSLSQPCALRGFASPALIERARLGVRRNMASVEFGPAELANLLAMSRSKLYRLLLPEGGVAHFINRERLLQARRELVADETVSIHAIAARVGFKDHSTFSRAFRRAFGTTPTQARASSSIRLQGGEALHFRPRERAGWINSPARPAGSMSENGMISPDLGF